jgi:hypothetical protein
MNDFKEESVCDFCGATSEEIWPVINQCPNCMEKQAGLEEDVIAFEDGDENDPSEMPDWQTVGLVDTADYCTRHGAIPDPSKGCEPCKRGDMSHLTEEQRARYEALKKKQ